MAGYVVFLRGINVSGKNTIKMAELKKVLEGNSFENVVTYIQSGNVLVKSHLEKKAVLKKIQELIYEHFGFNIHVFVFTLDEVENALRNNPFPNDAEPNKVYITFLDRIPDVALVNNLKAIDFGKDVFKIIDDILYFHLPSGMANSKLTNNFFEKKWKVTATGRNLNTIHKIIDLAKTTGN